jgi:ribosome-binding protein aMBF1 (putative translation factor)
MSEHTKKLPTNEIRIKISKNKEKLFLVPKDKVKGVMKLLSEYEKEETIPWKEVFSDELEGIGKSATMLKGSRAKEGMTQKELAKKLKTSQPAIASFENGSRAISNATARKLAKIFKTDYRIFLQIQDELQV